MVTMKVTDKNVIDLPESDFIPTQLHLGSLTAVYQKQPLMHIQYMSGRISV